VQWLKIGLDEMKRLCYNRTQVMNLVFQTRELHPEQALHSAGFSVKSSIATIAIEMGG
jgi:hypothetical protein